MTAGVVAPLSPYKGLTPFEDSDLDALLFFGRERESEVISANLMAARITVLYGSSGVGKSSVLRAGVAHRLRQEQEAEVVVFSTWTGDPVAGLIEATGESGDSLVDAVADAAARSGGDLYVILDQFEEYFLYNRPGDLFARQLAELVQRPGLRVNVLIGMREDALARLDALKASIPNLLANRLRLERLDRAAGKAAIVGPIGRYNELAADVDRVELDPDLVEAVLDEVTAGRVDLGVAGRGVVAGGLDEDRIEAPFLQLVLARLWEVETQRGSRTLQLATLRELGGAGRIVEDHLEHAMAALSPREKGAAAAMYNFLVTPSGAKIAHGVRDLAGYADVEEGEAAGVLQRLTAERIVRASSENGPGTTRYEIFHDVLADAVLAWRSRYSAEVAVREAERRRRRARFVAAAALVGLVLVGAIAVYALLERSDARTQARRANARRLAAAAALQLPVDPLKSIALGIRAAQLDDTPETERVLRDALQGSYIRQVNRMPNPVAAVGPSSVVFGDADGRLLWFPRGRGAIHTEKIGGPVTALALSRDEHTYAAGVGRSVVVSHQGMTSRSPLPRPPTALAVGGGGTPLAAGFEDGTVRVLRPHALRLHVRGPVASLAFSRDSRLLLVTSKDRRARLVDVRSGRVVHLLRHKGFVNVSAFSPDGRFVATGSEDKTARLWDARTGKLLRVFGTAVGGILAVAFSPDGRFLAAASSDGIARVYDAHTGERLVLLNGHATAVTAIAFSPDGKTILTGSSDRTAKIWMTDTGRLLRILTGHTDTVSAAYFTAAGKQVVTAGTDGAVRVWDSGNAPELTQVLHQRESIKAIDVSSDRSRLLIGDAGGNSRVWSLGGHRFVRTDRLASPVTAVAFGAGGKPVAATEPESAVAYSAGTGLITAGPKGIHGRGPRSLALRPPVETSSIALSRDGSVIAGGAVDGTVRLWNTRTGKLERTLRGHRDEVLSVAFSPGGNELLSASRDGDARLWNLSDGTSKLLRGHGGPVFDANFSSDGRWIVTAGPITAGVWPVDTGRLAFLLHGHGPVIRAAMFAPHSLRILTAGDDGSVRTYDCVVCRRTPELVEVARARLAAARPR
jgi:WD40 repeat protein